MLLTAYLSRGTMLYTAILLVLCAIVFFSRKTPKKRRIFCGAVVIYCILYFVVVFVLGSLFSSNHEPTRPAEADSGEVLWDAKPSVVIDGVLYGSTGRSGVYSTSTTPENGGHVDGEITSTVESHEYPTEDNQSNFGTGFYYRHGENDSIEVFFDSSNKWIIFESHAE